MRGTASERAGVEYALCLRTVRGLSADSLWTFFLTDEMSSPTPTQMLDKFCPLAPKFAR